MTKTKLIRQLLSIFDDEMATGDVSYDEDDNYTTRIENGHGEIMIAAASAAYALLNNTRHPGSYLCMDRLIRLLEDRKEYSEEYSNTEGMDSEYKEDVIALTEVINWLKGEWI